MGPLSLFRGSTKVMVRIGTRPRAHRYQDTLRERIPTSCTGSSLLHEARVQRQPQGHSLSSAPKPRLLCFPQEYEAPGCRMHPHFRRWLSLTRIGNEHPDSLITYPDARFLSGCAVPIQMRPQGYPQGIYPLPVVSTGHHLALSSLLMMVRNFVYDAGFHHHHPSSRLTS